TLDEGLGKLAGRSYDAVLLELKLPDAPGFAGLARVLQNAPRCPVVVLDGVNDEEVVLQAIQKGAQDFLLKGSINGTLLYHALRRAVRRGQVTRTLEELAGDLEESIQRIEALTHEATLPDGRQPASTHGADASAARAAQVDPSAPGGTPGRNGGPGRT